MHYQFIDIALTFLICNVAYTLALLEHRSIGNTWVSIDHHNVPLDSKLHHRLNTVLHRKNGHFRRDTPSSNAPSTSTTSQNNTDGTNSWNGQVETACMTALAKLNGVASNPAGVAACYNIPSYDNVTGAFQADLRLYQISPPASSWATLIHQGVSVGLTFPNGTMAAQQSSKIIKRDDSMLSWPPIRHIVGRKIVERASSPQLLSNMTLAGQVGTGMMSYYKDP